MSIQVRGSAGNLAEVDPNNRLEVALADLIAQAGYAIAVGESHNGANGVSAIRRALRVSTDGRLRAGIDTLIWSDTFNHGQQDTGRYSFNTTTMTTTATGGALNLNAGGSVAAAAVARVQTHRTFRLEGGSSLNVTSRLKLSLAPTVNNVLEVGLFLATGTTAPSDGVFFRLNSAGVLTGVIANNSVELPTVALLTVPAPNVFYELSMIVDQNRAEFYVNGVCQGVIDSPETIPCLTLSRGLPFAIRAYNSGVVTGSPQIVSLSDAVVYARDLDFGRTFPQIKAGMVEELLTAPPGAAPGATANYVNSTAPTVGTPSNTVAGYTTLGGQFLIAAPAGAETDLLLFSYTVPAAAAAGGNKNAVLTGLTIDTLNIGVPVATTPTVLQWAVGVGSTADSLATADSATAGTRARRPKALGYQTLSLIHI